MQLFCSYVCRVSHLAAGELQCLLEGGESALLAKHEVVCQEGEGSALFLCKAVFCEVSPAGIRDFHTVKHQVMSVYRNSIRAVFHHVLRQYSKTGLLMGFLKNQLQVNFFPDFILKWRTVGPVLIHQIYSSGSTNFCWVMLWP